MISVEYATPINCCAQLWLDEIPQSSVACCCMAVLLLHLLLVDNQVGSFLDNFLVRWSNGSLFKPWYGPLQIRVDNLVWEELAHPLSAVDCRISLTKVVLPVEGPLNRSSDSVCLFGIEWSDHGFNLSIICMAGILSGYLKFWMQLPPHHKHCSLWWFTKFCLHSS